MDEITAEKLALAMAKEDNQYRKAQRFNMQQQEDICGPCCLACGYKKDDCQCKLNISKEEVI
jgi:hypothetical protein